MLVSPPVTMFQANYTCDWWLDYLIAAQEPTDDLNRPMSTIHTSQRPMLHFHSPELQQPHQLESSPIAKPLSNSSPSESNTVVKKLNHNASERDRRKKLNSLYSSLRSLLPGADRMKKQSIPTTVSRVLKYVPELKQQLERLLQEKQHLLSRVSLDSGPDMMRDRRKSLSKAISVTVSPVLSGDEVVVQISHPKDVPRTVPLSEVMGVLEKEGFMLMNASSFEPSVGGSLFYSLHVQSGRTTAAGECEAALLREKILSVYSEIKPNSPLFEECLIPTYNKAIISNQELHFRCSN